MVKEIKQATQCEGTLHTRVIQVNDWFRVEQKDDEWRSYEAEDFYSESEALAAFNEWTK